jgi:hypothetical protein
LADTKYSALTITTAAGGDIFAVAKLGTSFALTISSAIASQSTSQTQDQGILFTNVNVVSSDTSLQYHYSTQVQHLAGSSSQIWMNSVVAQPATTAASTMSFYARTITGAQVRPVFMGSKGLERPLQVSLYDDTIALWAPTTSAPGRVVGADSFTLGSFSSASGTVGNAYTTKKRSVYKTASNAANSTAGMGFDRNEYFQSSTSGYGGYFFFCRFGLDTFATSVRYFVGLTAAASSAICTSNIGLINSAGFSFNDNVTTWKFYHASTGAGTTETISGQTGFADGSGYDVYIYAPANTTVIYYRLDELNTGSTIVNSSVANHLPNSTTFMKPVAMCGALNTSTNAGSIGVIKMYCESDI